MKEKYIRRIFLVGLVLKAIDAFFEVVGGIFFFLTGTISALLESFVPSDFLGVHSQFFIAIYLFLHGIVKIFLVVKLYQNKYWAYPAMIIFLAIFLVYEIIQVFLYGSFFMEVFTLIDLVILWLTWHEYQRVKKHLPLE